MEAKHNKSTEALKISGDCNGFSQSEMVRANSYWKYYRKRVESNFNSVVYYSNEAKTFVMW